MLTPAEIERAFDLRRAVANVTSIDIFASGVFAACSGDAVQELMRARVFVTLKPSVFDPQGKTIADALHSLGYGGVEDVRQGKYFELELATTEAADRRGAGGGSRGQAAGESGDRELSDRESTTSRRST